jgi:hypothetical protein
MNKLTRKLFAVLIGAGPVVAAILVAVNSSGHGG